MTPNLHSANVTAKIRRIVGCLDTTPHLFDERRWVIHRHEECIASEIGPNPTPLEDRCMIILRWQPTKAAKIRLIREWFEDLLIDDKTVLFMCEVQGIDPREIEG